jgi:hypothetical protein
LLLALPTGIIIRTRIWNSLKTVIGAGAVVTLLTGMASAQLPTPGIDLSPDGGRALTPEQNAIDEKYRATLKQIPEKRSPADPWSQHALHSGRSVQAAAAVRRTSPRYQVDGSVL